MSKDFCLGIALGMLGGALIVANSKKALQTVKESQETVIKKINDEVKNKTKKADNKEANS